jgi:hypothetical protein
MWLLLLACARPSPPAEAPVPETPTPSVRWSPDGRVLVDRVESFSPSGKLRAWMDLGQLHWGIDGGVSHLVDMPRWIAGDPAEPPPTLVAWVDEDRLYVHQIDVYNAVEPVEACKVYDTRSESWTEPASCVERSFYGLYAVEIRDGVAITESAGEGHPGLDAFRWTPESGTGARVLPELDLYPFGPVSAVFRSDGIALITPCHLEEAERPCQQPNGGDEWEGPWRHYAVKDGAFVLLRADLPDGALPHPTDADRYVWARPGEVCTGDPAGRHGCESVTR